MPAQRKTGADVENTVNGISKMPKPVQRMLMEMAGRATLEDAESSFSGEDLLGILEAETPEVMWEADQRPQLNAKVLSGCELAIYSFEVKFSNRDDINSLFRVPETGKGMYLLIHSARISAAGGNTMYNLPDPGERFTWNTSARFIVTKLWKAMKFGLLDDETSPLIVRIEGTDLGGGQSVEKLMPLNPVMVTGSAEPPF